MRIDLLGQDYETAKPVYSAEQFEQDVQNFKPRIFDTWILPGFMIYYAVKSKEMRRNARRILFTSGVYMMYRSYSEYKRVFAQMTGALAAVKAQSPDRQEGI